MSIFSSITDSFGSILSWMGDSIGQSSKKFIEIETAESKSTLVSKNGSLISIIKLEGAAQLVGPDEFNNIHQTITSAFSAGLGRKGHCIQVFFDYDPSNIKNEIQEVFKPSKSTAKRLNLSLDDLFNERTNHLSKFCATESNYIVVWTQPHELSSDQLKEAIKRKQRTAAKIKNLPSLSDAQRIAVSINELREIHHSFTQSILNELQHAGLILRLMDVHTSIKIMRTIIDPDVTTSNWQAFLPGDQIPARENIYAPNDVSCLMYPPIHSQVVPRDGENLDLRTCRIGDRLYSSCSIEIFPKEIKTFFDLFKRTLPSKIPWRISFLMQSDGINALGLKPTLAALLSFASAENNLIADSGELLRDLDNNSDEAIIKFSVVATTWSAADDLPSLRNHSAELIKSLQGWGYCEVTEYSGDAYEAVLTGSLATSSYNVATQSITPLSDAVYMLPFARPASPWKSGAVLFRTPDGKPWPYQPGSSLTSTWIDLIYARPGSGKSVLSNAINLGLCLQNGLVRMPRIAVIDIGPSSSGLISLLTEALPEHLRYQVAYHRLRLTPDFAINPFDTQIGCRYPTPQERSFLVNFLTLLCTPIGESNTYDGIPDMAGMIIDELYKKYHDENSPHRYSSGLDNEIDITISKLNIVIDQQTTWWEITDLLFDNDFILLAERAQRYAVPLLADTVSIARTSTIQDLYGSIIAPTQEPIISCFSRMISSAIREYPILSKITAFSLGEAKIVSLDLDEVAKSGGDAADRQTAIMYMIGRYVLAKNYYLTEENISDLNQKYQNFHKSRIKEIREDPKRIVMDEFHRTSKAQAVRDQVIVDMREGRKWKVQIALLSQSLDDFDKVMVEFATAIFILDAGPKSTINHSAKVFGLSETAKLALETRVHGPRTSGSTFLAIFSTKYGQNLQLCTSTLGPIELWAFNTNADDVRIRNTLYEKIGAQQTRTILAMLYPSGTAVHVIEERMSQAQKSSQNQFSDSDAISKNIVNEIIEEIVQIYLSN